MKIRHIRLVCSREPLLCAAVALSALGYVTAVYVATQVINAAAGR